jgi:hypothetical protein
MSMRNDADGSAFGFRKPCGDGRPAVGAMRTTKHVLGNEREDGGDGRTGAIAAAGWGPKVAGISRAGIAALVEDIDRTGFGVIPGFVGAEDLARMRAFVARAVQDAKGEYAGLIGPDAVAGSGLDDLARSQPFREMMEGIYAQGTGRQPPKQDLYQLLRCLSGRSARRHSYFFHYDSYVVTALIPIEIPTTGQRGDLVMIPNTRRIRKSYYGNVLDKILLDNKVTQMALTQLVKRNALKLTRIKMVPGNAYFFWGYRSVHTNEPCDAGAIRATALFHYANPHAASS